ncbi:MAG: hypothetical protein AAFY76_16525, partial [Cyanobacteria bacterium J06649_11]
MPLGENGKFTKTIFYFLRADQFGRYDITVTGKAVNLGDGDGMQVPCVLSFGQKSMVEILKKQRDYISNTKITASVFSKSLPLTFARISLEHRTCIPSPSPR